MTNETILAQIAAAGLILFWGGWYLDSLGNLIGAWPLGLGVVSIPLTFVVCGRGGQRSEIFEVGDLRSRPITLPALQFYPWLP